MKPDSGKPVPALDADEQGLSDAARADPARFPAGPRVAALRIHVSTLLLLVAALAAVAGGLTWLAVKPEPRRIEILVPTPRPVVVQVGGAVAAPGVYPLPPGARVADAVAAAGGALASADMSAVNQAARLTDGSRIDIPTTGQAPQVATTATSAATQTGTSRLIDLNTATQAELESLPGIGPALATAIIEFRSRNGPITRADQLLAVDRIGPKTVETIRPFVVQQ